MNAEVLPYIFRSLKSMKIAWLFYQQESISIFKNMEKMKTALF